MTTSSEWEKERQQYVKIIEEQNLEINCLAQEVKNLKEACRMYRDAISINFWKLKDDNK